MSTTNGSVRHCIYRLGQALASAFLSAATVPYYYGLAATRERSRYCLLSLSYFKYEERKLSKARGFLSYYYGCSYSQRNALLRLLRGEEAT